MSLLNSVSGYSKKTISFDHLSPIEFENFCYDLLDAYGFVNLSWRKGTGTDASPADDGRDIECNLYRKDIDFTTVPETWFAECKRYKRGVPASELHTAITWADAEKPDVLLIIVSNFLSNSCKNLLEKIPLGN